jgi:glutamate dehydrogenase (NAD(P)+)
MGTDEVCMAWIKDETGRSAGLPTAAGGIPLDEIGATGWGVAQCAEVAVRHCGFDLKGARVAIQGFGAVGRHAARFLADRGAVLVAASDMAGTLHDPAGIDVKALTALKAAGRTVLDASRGEKLARDAVIGVDCDILIPAARPDVVRDDNAGTVRARLVLQGANIPFTPGAEKQLHARGVLVVPDFIANAGGVICAALEYAGATGSAVFPVITDKVQRNTEAVLRAVKERNQLPRDAAIELATRRVREAMGFRRFSIL